MLFSLRSTTLFSAAIAASPLCDGPVASIPPGADRAEPVVTPAPLAADAPLVADDPDELAVPALLVPGEGGDASFDELPAPLGSLPELLRPPALAGPDGTPLTPAVPAPAEPAFGEPAALPLPADGPLAAPPALPPLLPPPDWANELTGPSKIAMATIEAVSDILVIAISPFTIQRHREALVPRRNDFVSSPLNGEACDRRWMVVRKLIAFDDDTFDKLKQLARDRMGTLQELADEAFADLLKKHGIAIDLEDALRKSASIPKSAAKDNSGRSGKTK
jgi:hypothetical protein